MVSLQQKTVLTWALVRYLQGREKKGRYQGKNSQSIIQQQFLAQYIQNTFKNSIESRFCKIFDFDMCVECFLSSGRTYTTRENNDPPISLGLVGQLNDWFLNVRTFNFAYFFLFKKIILYNLINWFLALSHVDPVLILQFVWFWQLLHWNFFHWSNKKVTFHAKFFCLLFQVQSFPSLLFLAGDDWKRRLWIGDKEKSTTIFFSTKRNPISLM